MFHLRFAECRVHDLAEAYKYPGEAELIQGPAAAAKERGYLTKAELQAIAGWKSKRPRKRCAQNDDSFVREVTGLALTPTTSPRLSIESLTLLSGVGWPTASVILHLCHKRPYPILDFRALWSLSTPVPPAYDYAFWAEYTAYTVELAKCCHCDMRMLDRALWWYSKHHQDVGSLVTWGDRP